MGECDWWNPGNLFVPIYKEDWEGSFLDFILGKKDPYGGKFHRHKKSVFKRGASHYGVYRWKKKYILKKRLHNSKTILDVL